MLNVIYFFMILALQIMAESLPISSSGHVALVQGLMRCSRINVIPLCRILEHLAHLPTMIILMVFFRHQWVFFVRNIKRCLPIIAKLITYALIADVITVCFYMLRALVNPDSLCLGYGLAMTGVILVLLRFAPSGDNRPMTLRHACLLGCVQGIALWPGISRFAVTYTAARWLSFSPQRALEISFMIQWPLIAAACAHSLFVIGINGQLGQVMTISLMSVMTLAGICAYFLLVWAAWLAKRHLLWRASWYMIIPTVTWFIWCF